MIVVPFLPGLTYTRSPYSSMIVAVTMSAVTGRLRIITDGALRLLILFILPSVQLGGMVVRAGALAVAVAYTMRFAVAFMARMRSKPGHVLTVAIQTFLSLSVGVHNRHNPAKSLED